MTHADPDYTEPAWCSSTTAAEIPLIAGVEPNLFIVP
jgi:hypothetical protein